MSSKQKEQPPVDIEETEQQEQVETVECTDDEASDSVGEGSEALAALQEQLDKARGDMLRSQADMQNLRHRTERDVANAHKFALDKFVGELLPVVDNLERSLDASLKAGDSDGDSSDGADKSSDDPIRQGIELTLKSFVDVLKRFQVEAVAPAGEPFDPELHQAMSMVPNPDMRK